MAKITSLPRVKGTLRSFPAQGAHRNLSRYQSLPEDRAWKNAGGKQAYLKILERYDLKTGAQNHHSRKVRNHSVLLLTGLLFLSGTAGESNIQTAPTTKLEVKGSLPFECTETGSSPNDTWLDRTEVDEMKHDGTTFNGSYRGYTDICPNAFDCFSLNDIILSGNYLSGLPNRLFDDVSGVQRLYLDHNQLTTLPVALNHCPDLEFLEVSYNDIKEIPRYSLSNVTKLRGFFASGNRNLSQYPPDLFDLPYLATIHLENTTVSHAPYPPPSTLWARKTFRLKCNGNIITLVSDTAKLIFHMHNTAALAPKNWKVIMLDDPEGREVQFSCQNQSFGPFGRDGSRTYETTPLTDVSTGYVSSSGATLDPQLQNGYTAGVPLVGFFTVIFGITIDRLYLNFKANRYSPKSFSVGFFVVAVVVAVLCFSVAGIFWGLWVALTQLVVDVLAAILTVCIHSYLQENESKHNPPVVLTAVKTTDSSVM